MQYSQHREDFEKGNVEEQVSQQWESLVTCKEPYRHHNKRHECTRQNNWFWMTHRHKSSNNKSLISDLAIEMTVNVSVTKLIQEPNLLNPWAKSSTHTSLTMIMDKLAKKASKSPNPVWSKDTTLPSLAFSSFRNGWSNICSECRKKNHQRKRDAKHRHQEDATWKVQLAFVRRSNDLAEKLDAVSSLSTSNSWKANKTQMSNQQNPLLH